MKMKEGSIFAGVRGGEQGQTIALIPILLVMLLGAAALVIDLGNLYFSYQLLQATTRAAAIAGGASIGSGTAQSTAYQYSGDVSLGAIYNVHPNLNITGATATLGCISTTEYPNYGLPSCLVYGSQTSANAIQVTEQATFNTLFARLFGINSFSISATPVASARGGGTPPYNVLLVLDTTASMATTKDAGCTVPGVTGTPTAEQCAQYGVQQLLLELEPCNLGASGCGGVTLANANDEVGLMVFPGLTPSQTTTLSTPPQASAGAQDDYNCSGQNPSTVPYNSNPGYLILPFQYDYRTSNAAKTLNANSNLVEAVGGGGNNCPGAGAPGGQGTFYAGAIYAAQAFLAANTRSNIPNVMILLSDGDANASTSEMSGSATNYAATNECQQAVAAANAAKEAGTIIYSVSYGSEDSGCTTDSSYSPCQTMAGIASTPLTTYFFSVPQQTKTGGNSTVCPGAQADITLSGVFSAIGLNLTNSRLLPNITWPST